MAYWLLKSEPTSFSIDHLAAAPRQTTGWDGVRNYQARNMLRDQMRKGDLALFYHSSSEPPGAAGIVEIVRAGYPDATAFDPEDSHYDPQSDPANPRWYAVDVKLVRRFPTLLPLAELKQHSTGKLQGFSLLQKGSRLSVMPVEKAHWDFILRLAEGLAER